MQRSRPFALILCAAALALAAPRSAHAHAEPFSWVSVWIEPEGEYACLALAVDEDRRLEGDLRRKAAPRDLPDAARDEQSRVRAEHERRELHQRVRVLHERHAGVAQQSHGLDGHMSGRRRGHRGLTHAVEEMLRPHRPPARLRYTMPFT